MLIIIIIIIFYNFIDEGSKPRPKKKKIPADKRIARSIPVDAAGRPIFPIVLGSLTIHSLGVV